MFGEVIFLQPFGFFGGGTIGNVLNQWAQAGLFTYVLPFLLIFALIFGILARSNIFGDNKSINAIISLSVALLSLQFEIVPLFFAEIFPRLGVGLALILVALIVLGMFMEKSQTRIMFGFGAVVAIVIFIQTAGALGWSSSFWWRENWLNIIVVIAILSGMGAIINSVGPKKDTVPDSPLARALSGN